MITGSSFGRPGQQPIVRIGGTVVPLPAPAAPPFNSLTVPLPTVRDAGRQVAARVSLAGKTSQPATLNVEPWLASVVPVRTDLSGAPVVRLTGNDLTATPPVRFEGPVGVRTTNAALNAGVLEAPIPNDLTNGLYDVRAQLPGNILSTGRTL